MNLLAVMPKLSPRLIESLAQQNKIPIGSVPLLKLEVALASIGYGPKELEVRFKDKDNDCDCILCRLGGNVLIEAWKAQHDTPSNNP